MNTIHTCPQCEGLHTVQCPQCGGSGEGMTSGSRCRQCSGAGEVGCDCCEGKGHVDTADTEDAEAAYQYLTSELALLRGQLDAMRAGGARKAA